MDILVKKGFCQEYSIIDGIPVFKDHLYRMYVGALGDAYFIPEDSILHCYDKTANTTNHIDVKAGTWVLVSYDESEIIFNIIEAGSQIEPLLNMKKTERERTHSDNTEGICKCEADC